MSVAIQNPGGLPHNVPVGKVGFPFKVSGRESGVGNDDAIHSVEMQLAR